MFDRDYLLRGKHAQYAQYLRDTAHVFKRHIDIYMIGAIMGFLHGKIVPEDKTTKDDVTIFADVFIREKSRCGFIYRLLMLLDETTDLTLEQRLDRAFRTDSDEEAVTANMDLFNSYVRGGIEYLFEKFSTDCITEDDYINTVYNIVEQFKRDIAGHSNEDAIQTLTVNG
ncbi:MAG: hypothetical protein ACOYEQ_02265 [Bacillota bacterium]